MMGASSVIWVPLSNVFGRRIVLVVAPLIMTLCSMWCALATRFNSILAARELQGFGAAPADTVAPRVVGEIFFVHQHGCAMAVYTLFLLGGISLGGFVGGYIASNLGYKYNFWVSTALSGAVFAINLLLIPETLFDQGKYMDTNRRRNHEGIDADEASSTKPETVSPSRLTSSQPLTFGQSLKTGVYRGSLLKQLIAPWLTLRFPGTWMVMLHYGGLLGGFVSMATVAPELLAKPPYLWGANVDLFSLSGIVGLGIGAVATYLVADLLILTKAKHDRRGLYEPEDRLLTLVPALFLATFGILVFGLCAENPGPLTWGGGLVIGCGMLAFGLIQIPSVGFNYLVESYTAVSAHCFVMVTLLRAIISFAWTFFVGDWVASAGAVLPFGIVTMLMGVFSLLFIPAWLFGKRFRIATAQYLPEPGHH
ncbi:hypothetical protein MAP00_002940 [Monascus purpureus]|nr:hypothetical protein MAP00_002940 [Monascus purpureus]